MLLSVAPGAARQLVTSIAYTLTHVGVKDRRGRYHVYSYTLVASNAPSEQGSSDIVLHRAYDADSLTDTCVTCTWTHVSIRDGAGRVQVYTYEPVASELDMAALHTHYPALARQFEAGLYQQVVSA